MSCLLSAIENGRGFETQLPEEKQKSIELPPPERMCAGEFHVNLTHAGVI